MSLCAINNALNNNVLARRFMSVPEVRANEQLLFENMPVDPIRIKTYESEIFREPHAARNADEFVRIIKKTLRKRSGTNRRGCGERLFGGR